MPGARVEPEEAKPTIGDTVEPTMGDTVEPTMQDTVECPTYWTVRLARFVLCRTEVVLALRLLNLVSGTVYICFSYDGNWGSKPTLSWIFEIAMFVTLQLHGAMLSALRRVVLPPGGSAAATDGRTE